MIAPIAAFVLKCPECGAPQPGTTSTCTHCRVPLMWAPTKSLSRDDDRDLDVEDEPGTELETFIGEIAGGTSCHFRFIAQKVVRPTFLWIDPRCASDFAVHCVSLGVMRLLCNDDAARAPAVLFSRGRGFPLPPNTQVPGIELGFYASNETAHARRFTAVLRVRTLSDGAIGFTDDGRSVLGLPPAAPSWVRDAFTGRRR
jgi:hypothetical protein